MSRVARTTLVAPIAVGAALIVTLSGCGSSSTSSTASSAMSSASSAVSSASSAASSAVSSATSAMAAPASAAAGSLAASCSQIDAVMEANPDADAAGTAKKLEEIKAGVTTPDADLIGALAAAYQAIADNPNVPAADPAGEAMATAVSGSAKALGAACQSATTAPTPG
jgi:hypothetical protein